MFRCWKSLYWTAIIVFVGYGTTVCAHAAEIAVDQRDLQFEPNVLRIKAGDSVRFTDSDRIAHDVTVVNADGTSEDKGMDTYSQQIVVPFPKPGAYHVRCRIHPTMQTIIMVVP